jgi:hypothetical protein
VTCSAPKPLCSNTTSPKRWRCDTSEAGNDCAARWLP